MKFVFVCFLLVGLAQGQSTADMPTENAIRPAKLERANLLRELNSSLEQVISKVSPAVAQILVNGYGPAETNGHSDLARIVRQHAIGSGVIVDSNGYVITNAHVVEGAQPIRVVVSLLTSRSEEGEPRPIHSQQTFDAKVLGRHEKSDLA